VLNDLGSYTVNKLLDERSLLERGDAVLDSAMIVACHISSNCTEEWMGCH